MCKPLDTKSLSSRRHLLPGVAPPRTQRATFTALGSSLHEGTDWHLATYKAARAGSYQELRHCFFDFLLAKLTSPSAKLPLFNLELMLITVLMM